MPHPAPADPRAPIGRRTPTRPRAAAALGARVEAPVAPPASLAARLGARLRPDRGASSRGEMR